MIAPLDLPPETTYTFACVDPASIPAVVQPSPDPFVLVVVVAAILIPATLWTANEWRTWRVRRLLRQSVADALQGIVAGEAGRYSGYPGS